MNYKSNSGLNTVIELILNLKNMKSKTLLLFANPEFDRRFDNGISRLYQKFCYEADFNLEIVNLEFLKNHIPDSKELETLIIAGGDGTIHTTMNAIPDTALDKYIFGIIPAGTANEFARSLSIPISIHKSVEIIKRPKELYNQHLGIINGQYKFVTGVLYGLADYVLRITPIMAKHLLGQAAFHLGLVRFLFKVFKKSRSLSKEFYINNQKHITNYLLVNNASLKSKNLNPQEIENENKSLFSLIFIHSKLGPMEFIKLMIESQIQYHVLKDSALYYEQVPNVTLEFDGDLHFLIDGDPYILSAPLNIEFYKKPITVITG